MRTAYFLLCLCASVSGQDLETPQYDAIEEKVDLKAQDADRRSSRQVNPSQKLETRPHITDFTVKTTIISRYAFTAVSCSMINRVSAAKEGVFQVQIPSSAFISNFTMIIAGRVVPGTVQAKEKKIIDPTQEAKKLRNATKASSSENEMETFRMAVNIPGKNKATFLLIYEELLQRRLGKYELVTSIRPLQLVSKLLVDVNILELSEITYLEVPPLRNARNNGLGATTKPNNQVTIPPSTTIKQDKTTCRITFSPNIVQQAKIARNGILGDFIIRYDVERELGVGQIQVLNGFFVHYFAPKDLPAVPKNIVFIIDTSASMAGTKMKQTKEALFTILKDLRPQDHFNIVSFSNRIKVWHQGKLVPVSPDNIRDAKKFIYLLNPTGGTNINGGIQTGTALLSDYNAQVKDAQKRVSLIIFLTDGRPTVGEILSPKIVNNTKLAVQEKICVFSIGIGNDVDYRLLEHLSLENCGMVRRIHEEADAKTMLKGFYDEIGTPLLSDIHIHYTDDMVDYVTQNLFINYFNGSEIVIAGRLSNPDADTLHVQVTASNSDKSIVLESNVPLKNKEKEVQKTVASLEKVNEENNYIERLWGYLSVKELLKSRMRSTTSKQREYLSDKAKNLSVKYNFVTPLSTMVIELPDIQMDRPNADEANLNDHDYGGKPQSLHRNEKQPDAVVKNKEDKIVTFSKTSADGDPHFVVDFPLSKMAVCFNINGEPGDVIRLVSDHTTSGITVNGKLIGAPAPVNSHKKQRTYFSTITIMVNKPKRSYIEITPQKVILDGKDRVILRCDKTVTVDSGDLSVSVVEKSNVTVTIWGTVSFVILIHQYKNPAFYQRDHLGFYISNSKGLSNNSHGLLGQFIYQDVSVSEVQLSKTQQNGTIPVNDLPSFSATLNLKDRRIPVIKKQRKIYSGKHQVDCWFVKNNAGKLIDGTYKDYVVAHLFDTGMGPDGSNEA
ncbi:inter-alpha-trypsin inhibitor heavy chain H5 isoform X1 [Polypterus senegalus]|uniref:inter-alpha-trypsin inhibitor heavy chain H5 isoform X1 n=1 Tax=Polypterus senegalus TaxID=55291 RepID=UPI001964BB4E|nr:inter-alpha-trypsin inhibitor heavy chain H5 isoform X1 [Polypterus senegalus]